MLHVLIVVNGKFHTFLTMVPAFSAPVEWLPSDTGYLRRSGMGNRKIM